MHRPPGTPEAHVLLRFAGQAFARFRIDSAVAHGLSAVSETPPRMNTAPRLAVFATALALGIFLTPRIALALTPNLPKEEFGKTADGEPVELFTLKNAHGLEARVMTWGATLVSMHTPDRNGGSGHHARLRHARRLPRQASVFWQHRRSLREPHREGKIHTRRQGIHTRHEQRREPSARRNQGLRQELEGSGKGIPTGSKAVRFSTTSVDSEEGYPGTLHASVTYTLTDTMNCGSTTKPRPTSRPS